MLPNSALFDQHATLLQNPESNAILNPNLFIGKLNIWVAVQIMNMVLHCISDGPKVPAQPEVCQEAQQEAWSC
jgi:hypothetical protein